MTILGGTDKENETGYPVLHIDDVEDQDLAEMPDKGEMRIEYKIRSRTHNEDQRKGKKRHSCSVTMDITCIYPPADKSKKKNGDSDGGARKAFSEYFKDK